jgi:hypothetical protein
MDKLIIILLAILVSATVGVAQSHTDTSAASNPRQEAKGKTFVDEDGDGINDNQALKRNRIRRGNDKFVDRDGDGICDDRVRGLGFRRSMGGFKGREATGKGKGPGGRR